MSAAHLDIQSTPSSAGIWPALNRLLFTLIVSTLLTTTGYRMMPEIGKRKLQEARLDELKAEVEKEKQLLARNSREENLLKNDRDYLGMIARDRLDLMKDGETIYRLETKPGRR